MNEIIEEIVLGVENNIKIKELTERTQELQEIKEIKLVLDDSLNVVKEQNNTFAEKLKDYKTQQEKIYQKYEMINNNDTSDILETRYRDEYLLRKMIESQQKYRQDLDKITEQKEMLDKLNEQNKQLDAYKEAIIAEEKTRNEQYLSLKNYFKGLMTRYDELVEETNIQKQKIIKVFNDFFNSMGNKMKYITYITSTIAVLLTLYKLGFNPFSMLPGFIKSTNPVNITINTVPNVASTVSAGASNVVDQGLISAGLSLVGGAMSSLFMKAKPIIKNIKYIRYFIRR